MIRVATRQRTRYRSVRFGVETLQAGLVLPRHRHAAGYATVVLAGSFEEASFAGRFVAEPCHEVSTVRLA
jgi:anti-sigma factor ChrR (cupin superfamily)